VTYTELVNKSYSKTFSQRATLPKFIRLRYSRCFNVLDYGAGKDAYGTVFLRTLGFDCTAYDIGKNVTDIHSVDALTRKYDIIFASNVMNVQPGVIGVLGVISDVIKSLEHGGEFIFNYPSKPRYSNLTLDEIISCAQLYFHSVTIEIFNKQKIIICSGKYERS
jgi:SAM-dependent methyltransferase